MAYLQSVKALDTEGAPTLERAGASRSTTMALVALVVCALAGVLVYVGVSTGVASEGAMAPRRVAVGEHLHVSYAPSLDPIPVDRMHAWTLHVSWPDGRPVTGATVRVDGDMPEHGHGLPTTPQVLGEVAPGLYVVEGIRFQMRGSWVMDVEVQHHEVLDRVRFHLELVR